MTLYERREQDQMRDEYDAIKRQLGRGDYYEGLTEGIKIGRKDALQEAEDDE